LLLPETYSKIFFVVVLHAITLGNVLSIYLFHWEPVLKHLQCFAML